MTIKMMLMTMKKEMMKKKKKPVDLLTMRTLEGDSASIKTEVSLKIKIRF